MNKHKITNSNNKGVQNIKYITNYNINIMIYLTKIIILSIPLFLFTSCNQYRNSIISKTNILNKY